VLLLLSGVLPVKFHFIYVFFLFFGFYVGGTNDFVFFPLR
jgi:hypothetical protein